MKVKKAVTWIVVMTWFLAPLVYAAELMDAGNAMCPVSGDKASGKDFVDYNGKKYGLCCAMCADKFNKNPEKYLAEMSEEEGSHEHHEHHEHAM